MLYFFARGAPQFITGLHKFASGYAILAPGFVGDNLENRVTLVPSGAGMVCHVVLQR